MIRSICFSLLGLCIFCAPTYAQEVHQELEETVRAEVVRIVHEEVRDIVGTDTKEIVQDVQVSLKEGVAKGEVVRFENDLVRLEVGDSIYVNKLTSVDGVTYYSFKDVDRRTPLIFLFSFFSLILIGFAGFYGARALLSLGVSIVAIFFVLVPLLLEGYPPVLSSILVSGCVLALALFLTHGLRQGTYIAFLGTLSAIIVTGGIAMIFSTYAHFTGLSSDEAIFLNFSTKGTLDFSALLLGSIVIGILGILDDVAVTQAAVVEELMRANGSLSSRELYARALRVGRAHITSLVNTLSFAYVGAALPLILLMAKAQSSLTLSLNQEVVAVELARIFIGSIGLVLAVPFTTIIGVFWFRRYGIDDRIHTEHHHGHVH